MSCKLCDHVCSDHLDLLSHIKTHRIAAKKYFMQHWGKKDILNNKELIEYKSFEQYYLVDFTNKRNLKAWLKKVTKADACHYLRSKLYQYCRIKELDTAPSQAEIKTIGCLPSIEIFQDYCDTTFNEITKSIELKCIFDYNQSHTPKWLAFSSKQLIVDTREQKPFKFDNIKTISTKLECGDYAKTTDSKLVIERKGMSDFFSTLAGDKDRFNREIQRAKDNGIYMVVLVEASINTVLFAKRKFGQCSGDYVMHHMRQICRDFNNIQFVFCEGKEESAKKTLYILEMGEKQVRKTDLQFLFDNTGEISWL
jgi:ERCC4-type nuclease